jgi:glucose-6-phosphate 1-dehydrogenase
MAAAGIHGTQGADGAEGAAQGAPPFEVVGSAAGNGARRLAEEDNGGQAPPQPADPCVMVIFGGTGDLTKRKLVPALYNLATGRLLSREFAVVGIGRSPLTTEAFREQLTADMERFATQKVDGQRWQHFVERVYYLRGDLQDPDTYARLQQQLAQIDRDHGTQGNYFYYLAITPEFFLPTIQRLDAAGLVREQPGGTGGASAAAAAGTAAGAGAESAQGRTGWRRVIIEKPFGRDLESARQLNREIRQVLDERQIYRIDHYLGKETVQNILVFRFANGIFEPIWNRRYVDHVQITVAESVGVETRGDYYDHTGALRDMVPNHILQLISLTAMEPPVSFEADDVRDEQAKVLHAISQHTPEELLSRAVRGQYAEGTSGGKRVPGYRQEAKVDPSSRAETFVALKLNIENWRWAGVPFYLRTGKRLPQRVTEIAIEFRRAPHILFRDTPVSRLAPNRLVLHIQPDEGISLRFGAKVPGSTLRLGAVDMDFDYADYFGSTPSTGYERLLYDCMVGDATLFQRADMVEAGWKVVEPILDLWHAVPPRTFPNYAAGTWGPREADELLERDGRRWIKDRPIKTAEPLPVY